MNRYELILDLKLRYFAVSDKVAEHIRTLDLNKMMGETPFDNEWKKALADVVECLEKDFYTPNSLHNRAVLISENKHSRLIGYAMFPKQLEELSDELCCLVILNTLMHHTVTLYRLRTVFNAFRPVVGIL